MRPRFGITLGLLATASFILAQDANSGWKPVGASGTGQVAALQQSAPPGAQAAPAQTAPAPPPPQLDLKAGTYVQVRVNQKLSSDKNQSGDTFTATLVQPLVVDGFVVARPGQTFGGKVGEAIKASKAKGVSHLGLQLTDLMFVDGQHAPIQSELIAVNSPKSSHNPTTVSGTAGAAAGGTTGVLLTRGRATNIGPEYVLTFKVDSDVNIATDRAPQAFRPVSASDYGRPPLQVGRRPPTGFYAGAPYPYPYPYYGYPYWGPGVGVYFGGLWGPGFVFGGRWR
jgi:hypothetical protein